MSVTLTDDQYLGLERTLRRIAHGYRPRKSGQRDRITRDDQMTMAREICDDMGWDYSSAHDTSTCP